MLLWDTFFDAGETQLKNGKYTKAEKLLNSALGEANSFEPEDPRLLQTLLALIEVYQASDRPGQAEPHLTRAEKLIESQESVSPHDQVKVVEAQLKQLSFEESDPQAESALRERIVRIWQSAGSEYHQELLQSLLQLTESARRSGGEGAARTQLLKGLAVAEELHGEESEGVDQILKLLFDSYRVSADYGEAERIARRRLEIQTSMYGEDDPRLAPTLADLSLVLEKQRRMAEALPLIERASSLHGEDRTFYYLSFVEALLRSGAAAEALAKLITLEKVSIQGDQVSRYELLLLRAYQGVEDLAALEEQAESISLDPDSPELSRLEAFLVRAELSERKDEESIGEFLNYIIELDSEELDDQGDLLARVANLARRIGRREVSERFYDRAITARTEGLDTNDPRSVKVLFELGTIQERRRLLPDAVSSWERSLEFLRKHNGQVDTPAEERKLRIQLVERLADIYIRQRRWERAEQAWRSLVRSSPASSVEHAKGRLGLTTVYAGQEEHKKALDYLLAPESGGFEEGQVGRELSDSAFLLEMINLLKLGRSEEAAKKREVRFSRRGGAGGCSIRELAASFLIAREQRDEERFLTDGKALLELSPEGSSEQLLFSRFYELLAENNGRYFPPQEMPLNLTPLQALDRAIHWAIEANGETNETVAELYEESAKAAVSESAWEEAETSTRKCLEIYTALKGPRSAFLLPSLQRLGELKLGQGDLDEAVSSLEEALELGKTHLKPYDVQVRELLRSLVEAHRRRGEFTKSRAYLNQLLDMYQRYEELEIEGKLDDLMRGIRLLLGDDEDHRDTLAVYLDEATELAVARGVPAELSLAFCLGQKARLLGPDDPDEAIKLLRRQAATLENREEAPEFTVDQLLLARLLLFRGQPKQVLALVRKLGGEDHSNYRKAESERESRLLEARAFALLHEFEEVGPHLEELLIQVKEEITYQRAEVVSLKLLLFHNRRDLVGEEEGTAAYAELDKILEEGDWSKLTARHQMREKRSWELARIHFETAKLSPEAGVARLSDHLAELRVSQNIYPCSVADALAHLGGLEQEFGSFELAFEHFKEARELYDQNGDSQNIRRARVVAGMGAVAERLDHREAAVESYREGVASLEYHLGTSHPTLVPLFLGLGRLGRKGAKLDEAESALKQAVGIIDELADELPIPLRSEVLKELAGLYTDQKRPSDARETWVRLREMWEDSGELIPTAWMEDFGRALVADDAFAEALQFFLDTLPLRLGQGDDPLLLSLYGQWLEMTVDCEPTTLAEESAEHLAEIRDVVYSSVGEDPPPDFEIAWSRILVGFSRLHLAGLLDNTERVKEDLEEALRIREHNLGPETTPVGDVLSLRSELAFIEEDLTTAENCLTRALNIVESNLGPDTWEVAEILLKLATVYFKKQRFSPTEAVLQRTLELCRTLLGENDQRWIQVCHLRGKLSLELGRPGEAFGSLDRALTLCKKHLQAPGRSLLVAAGKACLLTDRPERALELFQKAEAYFADEVELWDEETEDVKLALGELLLDRERYSEAEERLAGVLSQQEKRYGFGDPNLCRVYRALGQTAIGLGELDTAEERLEIALALQEEELFSPYDLAEPFYNLALLQREKGAEERACHLLRENLERARPTGRHESIAKMSHLLAESCQRRGEIQEAEESWRETIDCLEKALELAGGESEEQIREKLLEPLHRLSELLLSHRRYTSAEELTKRRLKISEELGRSEEEVATVLFDLAELYRVQDMYKEAGKLHERVLETRIDSLGSKHPEVGKSLTALGQIALGAGATSEAQGFLDRALGLQQAELGDSHPDLATTLFALGDLALTNQSFEDAEERYREALKILESEYGEESHHTAKAWTALARLYEQKQQWSRAQPLLGRAVESVEAVLGPSHLEVADLLEKTAKVYLVSGEVEKVSDPLERSLTIRSERLGENHPAVARVLRLKAEHQDLLGDLKVARKLFGKADTIVADHYGADSTVRREYRFPLARALRRLGEHDLAQSHLEVMMEQLAGETGRDSLLFRAGLLEEQALLKLATNDLVGAEKLVKECLDTRSKFLSPNSEEVSSAFESLARIHQADDREVTASALAERALDALESEEVDTEGRASVVVSRARIQMLLARIELAQGGGPTASSHAHTALNLLRDLLGEKHPDVATVLHLLGEIAQEERKLEKAESYFEEALGKWEAFFGSSHQQVCRAVSSLAQLYQEQGRLTLAEQYHQRNLVSLEGRFGSESPILVATLLGLGKLCRSQGNTSEAEGHLKRAAEIQGNVSDGADLKMADVLHTLALVYQDQRNFIASEALLKKARDLRQRLADEDSAEIAESNLALARLYRTSGKATEAEPLLKSVLEWRTERLGSEHPEVASLLREMAELYADQKEYLKAQSLVRKALGIYGEALGHRNLELVGPLRQLARLLDASGDSEEAEKQRLLAQELMGAG